MDTGQEFAEDTGKRSPVVLKGKNPPVGGEACGGPLLCAVTKAINLTGPNGASLSARCVPTGPDGASHCDVYRS